MALIKCPECFGSISSTSKKCVHCGFEISICPECNAFVEPTASSCSQCGYKLEKTSPTTNLTDLSSIDSSFSKKFPFTKLLKQDNIVTTILDIAMYAFAAISVFVLFCWIKDTDHISNIYSVHSGTTTLFVFAIIFGVLKGIYTEFAPYLYMILYSKNLTLNSVDILGVLRSQITDRLYTMSEETLADQALIIRNVVLADQLQNNALYRKKEVFWFSISALLYALAVILIGIFLIRNTQGIMQQVFLQGADNLNIFSILKDFWLVVVGIILYVFNKITSGFFHSSMQIGTVTSFIESKLPECIEVYNQKILIELCAD